MVYSRGSAIGGGGFNPYAAGNKHYGSGLRSSPNIGPVDRKGYAERDLQTKARRNAILQRLRSGMQGNYASANFNRKVY
jgi:hypothetical protein